MKTKREEFDLEVRGTSMEPYLKDGQVVKMIKFKKSDILNRYQIVLFTRDQGKSYQIKRVVGLPGESVGFVAGDVYIKTTNRAKNFSFTKWFFGSLNKDSSKESKLSEDYLASHTRTWKLGIKNYPQKEKQSEDLWEPVLADNQYYILGDNRTSSKDSRNFGPITENQVKYLILDGSR
jgi:signal peptidase I